MCRNLTLISKNTSFDCHSPPAVDFSLPFAGNILCRVTQAPPFSCPSGPRSPQSPPQASAHPSPHCSPCRATVTPTSNLPVASQSSPSLWAPRTLGTTFSTAPVHAQAPYLFSSSSSWGTPISSLDNHRELSRLSLVPAFPTAYSAPTHKDPLQCTSEQALPCPSPSAIKCTWKRATRHRGNPTPTLSAGGSQLFPKHQQHSVGAWMARVLTLSRPLQKWPLFPEAFQHSVQTLSPTLLTPL